MATLHNKDAPGYERTAVIYFAGSLLVFSLVNFGEIGTRQLALIYLPLLCLFLFNNAAKLSVNLDWLLYGGLAAVVVFIASISASYPDHALLEAAKYRDISLLGFSLYLSLRDDLCKYSIAIFLGMVCAFLAVACITLWEFLSAIPGLQGDVTHINPELTYYSHIRHFSYHAFAASVLATICVINSSQKRPLVLLLLAGCLFALVINGGRGAIVGYAIFLALYGLYRFDLKLLVKVAVAATVVILGAGLVLALSPASALVESFLTRNDLSQGLNGILSGRIHLWSLSLQASFENPLFGYGPGGFQQVPGSPAYASQPHSFLLQLIVEFGWLGAGIILFCLGRLLLKVFRAAGVSAGIQQPELAFSLKCAVVAYLVFSLFDGLFYHPLPLLHFTVIFAVLVAVGARTGRAGEGASPVP